jgi:hypothetical protein
MKLSHSKGFISNDADRVKGFFRLFLTSLNLCFSLLGTPVRLRRCAVVLDG